MSAQAAGELENAWVEQARERMLEWYAAGHRQLPWRADRDPYRILVSEMMLVQTTVAAVVPYFERFLRAFPTIQALAEADETTVLKAWEGLGYYRRARQLHAAARAVVSLHAGVVPDQMDALRALPGVGRYIAGAVLSFAFDKPVPILEANTQRLLARWLAWREDLAGSSSQAVLWRVAERLVPERHAGQFNQALMELGATVCTPKSPMCLVCPVAGLCKARAKGLQDALPVKAAKAPPLQVSEACVIVVSEGRLLIVRRARGGLWEGLWEFPTIHVSGVDPAGRSLGKGVGLAEGVRQLTDVRVELGPAVKRLRYTVTKHRVALVAHAARGLGGMPKPGLSLDKAAWERPEALAGYPFGSPQRRLATWAAEQGAERLEGQVTGSG